MNSVKLKKPSFWGIITFCGITFCATPLLADPIESSPAIRAVPWKDPKVNTQDPMKPFNIGRIASVNIGPISDWRNLQVRIFRGKRSDLVKYLQKDTEDCASLASLVVKPKVNVSGRIEFGFRFDETWLKLNDKKDRLYDEIFYFRWEVKDSLPTGPIRLAKSSVSNYFKEGTGFHIIVKAPEYGSQKMKEVIRTLFRASRGGSQSIPGEDCVKLVSNSVQGTLLVSLKECSSTGSS